MPYPKGIKTPEVRAAWLAQRRTKVEEYDALVAAGLPRYKAAQAIGSDLASVESTRQSIERLEAGVNSTPAARVAASTWGWRCWRACSSPANR